MTNEKRDTLLDHLENMDKAIESELAQPETPTEFSGLGYTTTVEQSEPASQLIAATITLPNSIVVLNTGCDSKEEGIDWFLQLMGSVGNAITATNIMDNPVLIPKNLIEYVEISDYNEMKEFDKEMRERYMPAAQHEPTIDLSAIPKRDES